MKIKRFECDLQFGFVVGMLMEEYQCLAQDIALNLWAFPLLDSGGLGTMKNRYYHLELMN